MLTWYSNTRVEHSLYETFVFLGIISRKLEVLNSYMETMFENLSS